MADVSSNQTSPSDAFKQEYYRQLWEQARHNERLRDTWTTFFALILGGTLVFLESAKLLSEQWPWWFPFMLSVIGLGVSIRAGSNSRRYTNYLKQIEKKEGIPEWHPRTDKQAKFLRIDNYYVVMYVLTAVLFFSLAMGLLDIPGAE